MNHRTQSFALLLFALAVTSWTVGCSMCCDTYDYDYPNYGGKHQRADPVYGRLGSVFSDPGPMLGGMSADSNLKQVEDKSNRRDDDGYEPESINPQDLPNPDFETTPQPEDQARRRWETPPLRSGQQWR